MRYTIRTTIVKKFDSLKLNLKGQNESMCTNLGFVVFIVTSIRSIIQNMLHNMSDLSILRTIIRKRWLVRGSLQYGKKKRRSPQPRKGEARGIIIHMSFFIKKMLLGALRCCCFVLSVVGSYITGFYPYPRIVSREETDRRDTNNTIVRPKILGDKGGSNEHR